MSTKEREYHDKDIILTRNEVCKISELSKEERDIYFAGYDDGKQDGLYIMGIVFVAVIIVAIIVYIIEKYY